IPGPRAQALLAVSPRRGHFEHNPMVEGVNDRVLSTITSTVRTSPATLRPSARESRRGPAGRGTLAPELEKGKVGRGLRRLVTASSPDIPARVRAQSADFCGGGNHVPWSLDLPTDRNWKWQRNLLVRELLPGRARSEEH